MIMVQVTGVLLSDCLGLVWGKKMKESWGNSVEFVKSLKIAAQKNILAGVGD